MALQRPLVIYNEVLNNLIYFRTLWELCNFFYTRVFHLEIESSNNKRVEGGYVDTKIFRAKTH